jgi:hypothetical protein
MGWEGRGGEERGGEGKGGDDFLHTILPERYSKGWEGKGTLLGFDVDQLMRGGEGKGGDWRGWEGRGGRGRHPTYHFLFPPNRIVRYEYGAFLQGVLRFTSHLCKSYEGSSQNPTGARSIIRSENNNNEKRRRRLPD